MEKALYTSPFTNDKGFVFHNSFYNTFLRIQEHDGALMACHYLETLMEYAMKQKVPNANDPVWVYGLSSAFFTIDVDAGRATL